MNPAWKQEQDGIWSRSPPGYTAEIVIQEERAAWSVATRAGALLGEGWVPFTNDLAPERYAIEAAAHYAEMFFAAEAQDEAPGLRERVVETSLTPLVGRHAAQVRLQGGRVVANAVSWLKGAQAAAVMRRRGQLEVIAAWEEEQGIVWYSGVVPRPRLSGARY